MKKLLLILLCVPLIYSCENKQNNSKNEDSNTKSDFISNVDLKKIYNNQLSMDFVVLGIFGNELFNHYENCKLKKVNLYSYDTIWNINNLNEKAEEQKKPRIAFLGKDNFYLLETEIWDDNKSEYITSPYIPYISGYEYYLGNGFCFNNLNEISDYNNDGYMDLKIEFSEMDLYESRSIAVDLRNEIFEEYEMKIKNGDLSKDISFDVFEKSYWESEDNFGYIGIGYITRYSENGLFHFFKK